MNDVNDVDEEDIAGDMPADAVRATLRSDEPTPVLTLWDAMVVPTLVPEFAQYTQETFLYADLHGRLCRSRVCVSVEVDELVGLVEQVQAFCALRTAACQWQTHDDRVQLGLASEAAQVGSNITCDLWLRDAINPKEEHHCRFATHLPWVDGFLRDLRRMVLRCRLGQQVLG